MRVPEEVEAAQSLFQEESHMLLSTLLSIFGLGALCWMIFNLTIYAMPFAIALTSGLYLYEAGQGVVLSLIVSLSLGCFVAVLGNLAFERIRFAPLKLAIGLVYAVPAAIAGFHAAMGFAEFGNANGWTISILSWLGAILVGGTAWARVSGWSQDNPTTNPHAQSSFHEL
jgi:hypothetical protein